MTRARENADGARLDAPLASPAITGTPSITLGSDATGDVYYRAANGVLTRLATGADGTVLTSTGAGAVPAFEAVPASGITHASMWLLTSTTTGTVAANAFTANLSLASNSASAGFENKGAPMTQSGGDFVFPVTGLWQVRLRLTGSGSGNSRENHAWIYSSTNGTAWNSASMVSWGLTVSSGNTGWNVSSDLLFGVDNVSTHKVKFTWQKIAGQNMQVHGSADYARSYFTFIRLGDI
jgi:hypothetical protein